MPGDQIPVRISVVFNDLPALSGSLRQKAAREVLRAAHEVEAHAKRIVPVDTGALRNSIQTWVVNDLHARIAPHMEYAAYVEFGTRRQRAQPYMTPAAEYVRPRFIQAMMGLVDG